jgi:hypothetical protein
MHEGARKRRDEKAVSGLFGKGQKPAGKRTEKEVWANGSGQEKH